MSNEHQRGTAFGVAGEQQIDDLLSCVFVQIAGRLIGDDNLRVGCKRARKKRRCGRAMAGCL